MAIDDKKSGNGDKSFLLIDDKERFKKAFANETARERVRKMYSLNEFGLLSPELQYVLRTGSFAFIAMGMFGGIKHMNQARRDFLRKNVANTFESEYLAKRKLSDTMLLAAFRGGFKYGLQYGAFSTLYLLATMTAANYNNKVTIWEHIASGALLGSVIKLNYGPKGSAVGGILGGVLGLISGGIIIASMKITGVTVEELRYYNHEYFYSSRFRSLRKSGDASDK